MKKRKKMSYEKLKSHKGIYKHPITKRYMARKKVKGKNTSGTFDTLYDAKQWLSGKSEKVGAHSEFATLGEVWTSMQEIHFPALAESTKAIWIRRFDLLKCLEEIPMNEIVPSLITSWVEKNTQYFKSEEYLDNARGYASRCNLNNELNLFTTIFNWYKDSERYEKEALFLTNPIKTKHKKLGFIKTVPLKNMTITMADALNFFANLKQPYKDLAMFQFFTASRISEASGLQFSNIDLERKKIVIQQTSRWDMEKKNFLGLNPHPKNKQPRLCYVTMEIEQIINRRLLNKIDGNDFVFHIEGKPLDYSNIQVHFKSGQSKARLDVSGTHILRHGMAKLARKHGGGLDAVIAMTGHKDLKLADHYSKNTFEDTKEVSEKVMKEFRKASVETHENVSSIEEFNNNMLKFGKTVRMGANH